MHRGVPEGRQELLPCGATVLVEDFYTLRHLCHDTTKDERDGPETYIEVYRERERGTERKGDGQVEGAATEK